MDKLSKKSGIERLIEQVENFEKLNFNDPAFTREVLPQLLESFHNTLEELQVTEEELRLQNEELAEVRGVLEAQRKEYKDLFELAPLAIIITDTAGLILETNQAAQDLFHMKDSQVSRALILRVDAQERRLLSAKISEVINRPGIHQWEQRLVDFDKRVFPAVIRATALEETPSRQKRILFLIQDITERKLREKERENARAFAENLFQTIRQPLIVLRDDLGIILANASFYRTFQVKQEETEGRAIYDLGGGQWNIPHLHELLSQVISNRSFFENYQVEHEFPVIGRRIVLLNARYLYNELFGKLVLLAIEDVTERIDSQRKLRKLMQELKQSNQELEQFAYIASHDLQEPLRMVTSYVQLLAKRYGNQLGADADEFIGYAVDGATRMKSLIESLLQYSRVQTRAKEPEPVNAEEILNKVIQPLEHLIRDNQAVITHDVLPTVMADPAQLSMVFQNLIENSIKFRKEGKAPRIHISAQQQENEYIFSVSDNGIGIEERYHDRIFRLFQRLHTHSERPGTGIGLAICKRVVERHGGRIWFDSIPGEGTTFYFTIPRRKR
jgi:PAS domain S-box-containing protein